MRDPGPAPSARTMLLGAGIVAVVAVGAGLVFLTLAGAPIRYVVVNLGAAAIGLTLAFCVAGSPLAGAAGAALGPAIGMTMIATAVFGNSVDGASRWFVLGGFAVQPSFVLLPALVVLVSARRDPWVAAGAIAAAAGLALQPDRAMAAAFAAALAVETAARPSRPMAIALVAAIAALSATFLQPDRVPPQAFVEGVLADAFSRSTVLGAAVAAALFLAAGWFVRVRMGVSLAAFWAIAALASMVGPYPTPLVGYGASPILGYLIGAGVLASAVRQNA